MRRTLVLIPLLVALAACGGGNEPKAGDGTRTVPESSAPSVPTVSATPVARSLNRDEIKAALLSLSEMPPGFSVDEDDVKDSGRRFCNYKLPHGSGTLVRRDFAKGAGLSGELFSVSIRQFETAQQAKESFDALETALTTCKGETVDGTKLTYSPMSTEELGQGALGVKVDFDDGTILQNFVLDGPSIVTAGTGGSLNSDVTTTLSLLRKQVEKYETASIG